MKDLMHNIRFKVLVLSGLYSLSVFLYITQTIPPGALQTIRLTQIFALSSLFLLYIVLLASPFCRTFTQFPWQGQYLKARRALGVSTFYFALLHACFAFFGQLGGFEGLFFLSSKYLFAISLSFCALVILLLMAMTSFDVVIDKMGITRWKRLHRFVYLAGVLILTHALFLGTHFSSLTTLVPQITFSGLAILFILEAYQTDILLRSKYKSYPQFGILLLIVTSLISGGIFVYTIPSGELPSLNVHSQHIQLAQDALKQSQEKTPLIPGLDGVKTRRYSVSFNNPQNIIANQDVSLSFTINQAENGNPVYYFKTPYEKQMHVIIVDNELNYFSHIHPIQQDNIFSVTTQFPHEGYYHIYTDFQAFGGIEQQFGYVIKVGNPSLPASSVIPTDTKLSKQFGPYYVTLSYPSSLKASDLSIGKQKLTFTVMDAVTHSPIKNLKPYLNAFGHVVMINEKTYDYLHVHPSTLKAPPKNANGGPTVEFLPIGIYGPFKPGIYRIFAQFNPDDKLFTADFTVTVE